MNGSGAALFLVICLAVLTGVIAYKKGESFWLYALGGALLAIVFLPIVIFMKPNTTTLGNREIDAGRAKLCPWCMSLIHPYATVCPYCQREQPAP